MEIAALFGVPLIKPVVAFKVSPPGREPLATLQVYVGDDRTTLRPSEAPISLNEELNEVSVPGAAKSSMASTNVFCALVVRRLARVIGGIAIVTWARPFFYKPIGGLSIRVMKTPVRAWMIWKIRSACIAATRS